MFKFIIANIKSSSNWIVQIVASIGLICTVTCIPVFDWPICVWMKEHIGVRLCLEVFFFSYLLYLIGYVMVQFYNLSKEKGRKVTVEKLTEFLSNCLEEINKAKNSESEKEMGVHIVEFINRVKRLYDLLTDSHCCVSLKLAVEDVPSNNKRELPILRVKNVLRDQSHVERDTAEYKSKIHNVSENTAYFITISRIRKKWRYYVCNDIESMGQNYLSSSYGCYQETGLPYSSEIVYAIINKSNDFAGEDVFRGFLCIDSDKKNAFKDELHAAEYAHILSDALFWLIPRLRTLIPSDN